MSLSMQIISTMYKENSQALLYFAWKILGNKEEAQDTVSVFWAKLVEQPPDKITKSLLYVSVKNACLDLLKAKQRRLKYEGDYASWADPTEDDILRFMMDAELANALNKEIEKLPPVCKLVFNQSYINGLSISAISLKYNIAIQTVYNQRVKAISKLKLAMSLKK